MPRRQHKLNSIPLELVVIFASLIAVAISGGIGILIFDREMFPYFLLLIVLGVMLNLALLRLSKPQNQTALYIWALHFVNIPLLTAVICLTGGLSSPYLLLYAPYIITGAVRKGMAGIARFISFSIISLLLVAFVTEPFTIDTIAQLGIHLLLVILLGLVAGWLGQIRIDAINVTRHHAQNMTFLNEIGRHLARPADSEDILSSLPERLKPVIDFDCYALYLYEENPIECLSLVKASGITAENWESAEQTALERHPGWVVRNQEVLRVENTETDARVSYQRPNPPKRLLYIPLRYEDRCLGAIGLGRLSGPPFSNNDEYFLQAVADQAVVSVQNALLYKELKEQTEQLNHAYEEMKELNRQRTELVRHVSHEIRNPLTYIKAHIEVMLIDESEDLSASHKNRLEFVLEKAYQMEQITDDILRFENPHLALDNPQPLDLAPLVRTALTNAEAAANGLPIVLRCELPTDLPQVWADQQKLNQILDNLLNNAIKYSPDGGRITISAAQIENMVEIVVADEGIGIPLADQAHVFEPYYRVKGSELKGHGLGLSIVKKYVEAHGGKIRLESTPEQGSAFRFTLPTAPAG